jgi:hypothetical protein
MIFTFTHPRLRFSKLFVYLTAWRLSRATEKYDFSLSQPETSAKRWKKDYFKE